jgi:putative membrane protein
MRKTSFKNIFLNKKSMNILADTLIALVAFEHLYILYMEMFAWTTLGKKTFKSLPESLFEPTKVLAANQGLYNGFLSAGLIWSLFISDMDWHLNVALFFLLCVVVAGCYGAMTAGKRIFYVQAVPAILASLVVIYLKLN